MYSFIHVRKQTNKADKVLRWWLEITSLSRLATARSRRSVIGEINSPELHVSCWELRSSSVGSSPITLFLWTLDTATHYQHTHNVDFRPLIFKHERSHFSSTHIHTLTQTSPRLSYLFSDLCRSANTWRKNDVSVKSMLRSYFPSFRLFRRA